MKELKRFQRSILIIRQIPKIVAIITSSSHSCRNVSRQSNLLKLSPLEVANELRYYATFRVRRLLVLQNCYIFAKNYRLHWIAVRANILDVAFGVPFLCYFQKLQLLVVKKLFQIFKILFQIDDIYIFVFRGVFFCRFVQIKRSIIDKKIPR